MEAALSDAELASLLQDDVPCGDLTTDTLGIGMAHGRLEFRARQDMTICAVEEAARLFVLAGVEASPQLASGQRAAAGELLLAADGSAGALHTAWKTAQILMEWSSGISTATAAIVAAASPVPVACTRKNVPGTKALSAKAVRCAGGHMHRLGLSETLLVFAEHRLFLDEAPAETVARLRRTEPEKKIVVEVSDIDEAVVWADAGADVLQLEKFSPAGVAASRAALARMQRPPLLAAAGGIQANNAAVYVAAGADMLVTSAPYYARPSDVAVTFFRG